MISDFLINLFFDTLGEIIGHFLPGHSSKDKIEKNIARLKEEEWFLFLYNDYRYGYIIQASTKINNFLKHEKNIKMVTSMDHERDKFILLIKEEHAKFVRLR